MRVFSWSIQSAHQRERSEARPLLSECSSCLEGLAGTSLKHDPEDNHSETEKPSPKSYVWIWGNHIVGPCILCHVAVQPWFMSLDNFVLIILERSQWRIYQADSSTPLDPGLPCDMVTWDKNKTLGPQNQNHERQVHFFVLNYLDSCLDLLVTYQ